ncbi:hypothetical protein ScPMuIL_007963 [Solemya velum]
MLIDTLRFRFTPWGMVANSVCNACISYDRYGVRELEFMENTVMGSNPSKVVVNNKLSMAASIMESSDMRHEGDGDSHSAVPTNGHLPKTIQKSPLAADEEEICESDQSAITSDDDSQVGDERVIQIEAKPKKEKLKI